MIDLQSALRRYEFPVREDLIMALPPQARCIMPRNPQSLPVNGRPLSWRAPSLHPINLDRCNGETWRETCPGSGLPDPSLPL